MAEEGAPHLLMTEEQKYYVSEIKEFHMDIHQKSSGHSDIKPQSSVPKQAWYSFIDSLKGLKAYLTLPSLGFEPETCGMEALYTTTQPLSESRNFNVALFSYTKALGDNRRGDWRC
ncbi:hypothetical protein TNCV_3973991 [Trichonephila clavipes]|nr:hypothetical protein TNCV_3973991 [Trichonephila clavipes]